MQQFKMYQVDAFTDHLFGGNPAAIVLDEKGLLTSSQMQDIAAENNLAETAFIGHQDGQYQLRYFTPKVEIDLCGHATLASAHVIFHHLRYQEPTLYFRTHLAGEVRVTRRTSLYEMNLPSWPPMLIPTDTTEKLAASLNLDLCKIKESGKKRDYLVVLPTEEDVKNCQPNFMALKKIHDFVCITAPTSDGNFVSRFFTPTDGIDEDPVTGSAHCMLVPYWAKKLGRTKFVARQLSVRGGTLYCQDLHDRILVAGQAITFMEGLITV